MNRATLEMRASQVVVFNLVMRQLDAISASSSCSMVKKLRIAILIRRLVRD